MIKVSLLADCSSSAAASCTGSSRSGQSESPGGRFNGVTKIFIWVKSRIVGGLLEYKGDLPLWGPACGELARGFSGPWSRSGCCPRCSLQGIVLVRGKIKAVCCDLGHCSLLFKSDPNAVYSPPNAVYWLQGSFQRSSLLPLLSFVASPPF